MRATLREVSLSIKRNLPYRGVLISPLQKKHSKISKKLLYFFSKIFGVVEIISYVCDINGFKLIINTFL